MNVLHCPSPDLNAAEIYSIYSTKITINKGHPNQIHCAKLVSFFLYPNKPKSVIAAKGGSTKHWSKKNLLTKKIVMDKYSKTVWEKDAPYINIILFYYFFLHGQCLIKLYYWHSIFYLTVLLKHGRMSMFLFPSCYFK